jgi:recombination protein RecA
MVNYDHTLLLFMEDYKIMAERKKAKVKTKVEEKTNYGLSSNDTSKLEFIPSGCDVLDCVLGGGYPIGRVSNIAGNESVGKTGVGVVAMANFRKKYPKGRIWYHDAEAAFDVDYAVQLGLPTDDRVTIIDDTNDVSKTYAKMVEAVDVVRKEKIRGIYVIDTLDALQPTSDSLDEGYDAAKRAGLINSLITKITPQVESANLHLMIVSQLRENLSSVGHADKYKVAGGKALGFYASQRVWLSMVKKLTKTIRGIKRPNGIMVKAVCKKNKIGPPFRECLFPVYFYHGFDNLTANIEFLLSVTDGLEGTGLTKKELGDMDVKDIDGRLSIILSNQVKRVWSELDDEFKFGGRSYEHDN